MLRRQKSSYFLELFFAVVLAMTKQNREDLIDFVEHLPGLANILADTLSHLRVPKELRGLTRTKLPKLSESFWVTRAAPPAVERVKEAKKEAKVSLKGKNVSVMIINEGVKDKDLR